MSDPTLIPEPGDLAKVGGGLGAGGFLTLLLSRVFGGQDKVIARLDALQVSVSAVGEKVAIMAAAELRRDADLKQAHEDLREIRGTVSEQGKTIARLEAVLERIREGGK